MPRGLQGRSGHGNRNATKEGRRCNGDSRLQTLGRSWHAFTRHNRSGGVLGMGGFIVAFVGTALLCFITWVVVLTREENLGDFYDYAFGLGMLGWLAGFPLLGIATFRVKV